MTTAWVALGSITLSSSASTVTFSSIPETYRDLVLTMEGYMATGDGVAPRIYFNLDTTGNNYNIRNMAGTGSGKATNSYTGAGLLGFTTGWSSSVRTSTVVEIMDYSATDKHKTYLSRQAVAGAASYPGSDALVGRWESTSAISSIQLYFSSGSYASGSNFTLYGSNRL